MDNTLNQLMYKDLEDPDIQVKIGLCHMRGNGTLQNYEEAVAWFRKAAGRGDCAGMNLLGNACFEGMGTPRDYAAAYRYYSQSTGFSTRPKRYQNHFDRDGNVILKADFSRLPGLVEAARRGSIPAVTAMGNCYFRGKGVATDYETAVAWYRQAADKGDPEAQWALGYAYATGAGVPRDVNRGFAWFREAARLEFIPALHNLSVCYAEGCGTGKDPSLADFYRGKAEVLKEFGNFDRRFFTPADYSISCRTYYLDRVMEELG